jgi:hypothetical protein
LTKTGFFINPTGVARAARYDEAEVARQKALDLNPQAPLVHLGEILIFEKRPHQALAEIEKEPSDWAAAYPDPTRLTIPSKGR